MEENLQPTEVQETAPEDTVEAILRRRPRLKLRDGGLVEEAAAIPEPESEEIIEAESPATEPAPEGAAVPEKEEPPKPKYETLEEYEKARVEAEKKMHDATTKAAEERKAREKAEQEFAEFKAAQEAEAKRREEEAARPKPPTEDEQDAIFENALGEISELDTTDPAYRRNAGRIWRKAIVDAGINRAMPDVDAFAEQAYERISQRQAQEAARTAEERRQAESNRIRETAVELAAKAGLNMARREDGRYPADYRLFMDIAREIPERMPNFDEGKTPLEEQVNWVVQEVLLERGNVVQATQAELERQRKLQLQQQALGRGSTGPARKPVEEPEESIASTLERQREARRIRR